MSAQTTGPRAVFISYASQDAEAAGRICGALRAAGVEVWFDRTELRGGDAWDQSIKRQIRECSLFLPVISAATQARREGYFRREWKLAVERTHDMDEGVPFLLPLALDNVNESEAFVPEAFLRVQWTKLTTGAVPPAFVNRVRALVMGEPSARVGSAGAPTASGGRPAREKSGGLPGWARGTIAVAGVSVGLAFAVTGYFNRKSRERRDPPPVSQPAEAASASLAGPASALHKPDLAPARVALARFENLTGDATLDTVARILEGELVRGLSVVTHVRVQPVEASDRKAALAAAREAGAGSVMIGQYLRSGDTLELTAEILLTEPGEVFGSVGPVSVPVASLRGAALAELVERLTTGANNVVVTLMNPPTRMAAVTYARPWARWPVALRLQALRAAGTEKPEDVIANMRALLAEAPELLKAKHDLARYLRDQNLGDEAEKVFRELLTQDRPRLSEAEIYAIAFDEALMNGDPDRALQAARGLLAIRPMSDAITQVMSCLWGQNRPQAAYEELNAWWQKYGESLPAESRFSPEAGLLATKATMYLRQGDAEKTLAVVAELKKFLAGRPFPTAYMLEFYALGLAGREAEQRRLVEEVSSLPGNARVEPVALYWAAYCYSLHAGRTVEAQRWLESASKAWPDTPLDGPYANNLRSMAIWLHEKKGDYARALALIDELAPAYPGWAGVAGSRAMVLQSAGRTEEAQALVKQLENWDLRNSRGMSLYWRARIAARAGDRGRAVELLRMAVSRGLWFGDFQSPTFDYGRNEPEFAALRGYEPYEQLLKPKG